MALVEDGGGILVVEDDHAALAAMVRGLGRQFTSNRIMGSSSIDEAILRATDGPLIAAIIDVYLPDGSGTKLISILRTRHPQMRIVMISGYPSIATAVLSIRLGADDFLSKPASFSQIAAAIAGNGASTSPELNMPLTLSLHRATWEHIQRVMRESDGNISEAARRLRIHRQSLQRMLRKRPTIEYPQD